MTALDSLIDDFVLRLRRGDQPDIEAYIREHPDLAAEIREVFPALQMLEGVGVVTAEAATPPPRQLGEYVILREVGRGGMGVVYEAVQQSLGRHVAIKMLSTGLTTGPNQLERFRREARAAAGLHHTNIVPVFAVGEQDGMHFYAMQFIRGQSLTSVIEQLRQQSKETPAQAVAVETPQINKVADQSATSSWAAVGRSRTRADLFRNIALLGVQAADALDYAHRQGIIHRDIKPSNLLLDGQGTLWVTDFGLAKPLTDEPITETGDVLGTLAYMAPEQLDGHADARTDVYALGLTLYELATLRAAFRAEIRGQLIEQVRKGNPTAPRKLEPRIPPDLQTIIVKAIQPEPSQRYGTAGDLARDLSRFVEGRTVLARRPSRLRQARQWCRRNPGVAGLLGAVGLLLIAIATLTGWGLFRERRLNDSLAQSFDQEHAAKEDTARANAELREATRSDSVSLAKEIRSRSALGRRVDSIKYLQKAAQIRPDQDLRDAAIASLSLIDFEIERTVPLPTTTWEGRLARDFTPDLEHHASFEDGRVVVRRTIDGNVAAQWETGKRVPAAMLFSPDGRWLAAGFPRGSPSFEVWDWAAQRSVYRSNDRTNFRSFDFAPDGTLLAVGMAGNFVRYIELPDFKASEPFQVGDKAPDAGGPWIFHFGPKKARLLVGPVVNQGPNACAILQPRDVTPLELLPPGETLYHAAWTPDESSILMANVLQVYQVVLESKNRNSIPRIAKLTLREHGRGLVFDPKGEMLLIDEGPRGKTHLYDLRGWQGVLELSESVARFDPTGSRVGLIGKDRSVVAAVLRPAERLLNDHAVPIRYRGRPTPLSHPDALFLTGLSGCSVLDLKTGRMMAQSAFPTLRDMIANQRSARNVVTNSNADVLTMAVRSADTPEGVRMQLGPTEVLAGFSRPGVMLLAWTPELSTLVIHKQNQIHVVDHDVKILRNLGDSAAVKMVALSGDGKRVALANKLDAKVTIYETASDSPPLSLTVPEVYSLAFFGPNSHLLIDTRKGPKAVDAKTGNQLWHIAVPTVLPGPSAVSPDGTLLAHSPDENDLRLYRTVDGMELGRLPVSGHAQRIGVLYFTCDGRRLIAEPMDSDLRIWDLADLRKDLERLDFDWPADTAIPGPSSGVSRPLVAVEFLPAVNGGGRKP